MFTGGRHPSSKHGLTAVSNEVQASPQKAAVAAGAQATPLGILAGVAERHSASGGWSPQPPPRGASPVYSNGTILELGDGTNGDSRQHGGRAIAFGTASYDAADGGTHRPPEGGAEPRRPALARSATRNLQNDFFMIDGEPCAAGPILARIKRELDLDAAARAAPNKAPIALGSGQLAGQMAGAPGQVAGQMANQPPGQMAGHLTGALADEAETAAYMSLFFDEKQPTTPPPRPPAPPTPPTPPATPPLTSTATAADRATLIERLEKETNAEALSLASGRTDNSLYELALRITDVDPDAYQSGAVPNQAAKQLAAEWVFAQGNAQVLGKRCRSRKKAASQRRLRSRGLVRNLRALLLEAPDRA